MPLTLPLAPPAVAGNWSARLRRGAYFATGLVAAIAVAGFAGWLAAWPDLATLGSPFPPLSPSGVALLVLVALALTLLPSRHRSWARRTARGAALAVGGLAAISLLAGGDDPAVGLSQGCAAAFLLLATALVCAPARSFWLRDVSRLLAVVVAAVAFVALVGLVFRFVRFGLAVPSLGMALPAALGLLASSFSLVALQPEKKLLSLLEHDTPGAAIFRRFLPFALVLPLLIGGAEALGLRRGWFDLVAAEGLVAVSMVLVCAALIWWISSKLDDMHVRRSMAEKRADTQREWLEVTLASIGDAVIAANGDGLVEFMNPAAETLCGTAASIGRPVQDLLDLVDERTLASIDGPLAEAFSRRMPVTAAGEPAVRLKDGKLKSVEASAMPILGGGGDLLGGVLILRDASEHREREKAMRNAYTELDRRVGERTVALERAAAALRERTALLHTIAASTPELILAKDRDCRIMMVNPAALQAMDLEREDVIGRREIDLFGESEETRRMLDSDQLVMTTGEAMAVEESLHTTAGERIFLVTKSPLRDEDGLLLGLVSVATDITERKQAQRELEQLLLAEHKLRGDAERASRAKDEFLAVVSHELRSPLNALKGWSQVLISTANPDPVLSTRAAQAIKRNVEHQTRLIDDLLDTSRIIIGKLVLEHQPVNLVDVVHSALDLSRSAAQAKQIELRFSAEQPVAMVNGDQGRLQQVVINLLSNGIKFTPRGGQVDIGLRQAGDQAELSVADNGIGIGSDFLDHVFDRFSQADASTTRRYSGLGIGLALVRHLVELHGGEVRVASAGPDKGSVFTVRLPAVDVPASAGLLMGGPESRTVSDTGLQGVRALVLDDDPDAREVLQITLARYGTEVHTFETGRALLSWLQAQPGNGPPTVLLLDIAMPGEDGFAVLARVRALRGRPFIPAIAVTALTHLDRSQLAAAGFQGNLGKPVDAALLVDSIVSVLGRATA